MSPRVLIVFSSSELGGAERSLTRMALEKGLGSLDYCLATLDGEGAWTGWVRASGVLAIVFGSRRKDRHGGFGIRAIARCVRHLRSHPVDIVYVIGLRASLWLRLFKPWLRGASLAHGVRWNPASGSLLDVTFRCVERWFWPAVDVYITNSRVAAETLERRCRIPRARIDVIYNGVPPLSNGLPAYAARPRLILTVANFAPRKGYLEYLDVVQRVVASDPEARFVFVGRDDMGGAVQAAIRGRGLTDLVRSVGYQHDVSPWMRQARMFVLPSLWDEGCPTAILEAKAHAVPVVAYAVDGIPEIVLDGSDGILIEAGNRAGLTDAVLGLLRDTERAERMGVAGHAAVRELFSLRGCAHEHGRVLARVLEGRA